MKPETGNWKLECTEAELAALTPHQRERICRILDAMLDLPMRNPALFSILAGKPLFRWPRPVESSISNQQSEI